MKQKPVQKILIIRLSSLGDILLTTPLLRVLRNANPDAEVDFLVRREYKDLLKLNPRITRLIEYDKDKETIKRLKQELAEAGYDRIIDLQNNRRSAAVSAGIKGIKEKFRKKRLEKILLVYFKINLLKNAPHIAERYLKTAGLQPDGKGLELVTDKLPSHKVDGLKNIIGFAPGSQHFTKMWPTEYYVELGKKLTASGYNIILLGGRSDSEICGRIAAEVPGTVNLSGNDDILQIAADMKVCTAVVCNDSGMMHTACAAGVPVLTIFGSTVKEFGFTPYKNRSFIFENNFLSCRPCTHIGRSKCPLGHFKCMNELTPPAAFENLINLLNS